MCVCIHAGCTPDSSIGDVEELYRQGNTFYERGQYTEAARTYERIIQQGFHNGHIYYNLGNAYFKQKKLGLAILAYERARRLMPRDPDVRANIEIANQRILDTIRAPESWIGLALAQRSYQAFTVNEASMATAVIFVALTMLIIASMVSGNPALRRRLFMPGVILGLMLAVAGVMAGLKTYDYLDRDAAIILEVEYNVRSGPGTNYEQVFALHEGTKVDIIERRGAWLRIILPDEKNGWIEEQAVGVI